MNMDALNPKVWAEMVEEYLGQKVGRWLNRIALLFLILGAIGFGGTLFFKNFVAEFLWPLVSSLFGTPEAGITLDNIEAVIIVLAATIVFFVVIYAISVIAAFRAFRRRVVPQRAIDQLAVYRSDGIVILNVKVTSDEELSKWDRDWKVWADSINKFLEENFTKAEQLSFARLGVMDPKTFPGLSYNPSHSHKLMMLATQLGRLEDLISRHQERR